MRQRFSLLFGLMITLAMILVAGDWGLAAPGGSGQEVGLWISHGPRGGRALALEVSPNFQSDGMAFSGEWLTSYRSTEAGLGIVRSTDAGQTWAVSDAGTGTVNYASAVHDFAFSPDFAVDQTVFAATWGGLFKSTDGGANWTWLEEAYTGPPGAYTTIAVAPNFTQSEQVLAGDWGGLLRSEDGGENWERFDDVGGAADIAFSPDYAAEPMAFASDGATVYRTVDGAKHWTPVITAPVTSLVVSPAFATDRTVFGSGAKYFYISQDAGTTWISDTIAADVTGINALAISPAFATDRTLFAGASNGLYWSQDAGQSWNAIADYDGVAVRSLAISPQWPQHAVLLVGADEGVYRMLTANPAQGIVRQPTGGFVALTASPLDWSAGANLLLTATSNHGVYGSFDDGQSWQPMGLQAASGYYSFSDVAISPSYTEDDTLFAGWLSGTGIGGQVYRSTDAGQTWQPVYSTDYVGDLALSPAFDADRTIFATSGERGLVRSTNGGDDWQEVGTWPSPTMRGRAQYVALPPDYPTDETVIVGGSQGVWRLPPGASAWEPAASGLTADYFVGSLTVSPDYNNDNMLLAVAKWSDNGGQQTGVFRSQDRGVNWQESSTGIGQVDLFHVTFSPQFAQDQTAYVTTRQGQLYRSVDGGQSWTLVGAAPGSSAFYDVLARPDGRIFVGSDQGVWEYVQASHIIYLPLLYGGSVAP